MALHIEVYLTCTKYLCALDALFVEECPIMDPLPESLSSNGLHQFSKGWGIHYKIDISYYKHYVIHITSNHIKSHCV